MRLLIKHGVDVDQPNDSFDGNTPLHVAALYGHHELVRLLVGAGANLHAMNDDGLTPKDMLPCGLESIPD